MSPTVELAIKLLFAIQALEATLCRNGLWQQLYESCNMRIRFRSPLCIQGAQTMMMLLGQVFVELTFGSIAGIAAAANMFFTRCMLTFMMLIQLGLG